MQYLPILTELFESDSLCFLLIGVGIGILCGAREESRSGMWAGICFLVYIISEAAMQLIHSYGVEFACLVIGTGFLGAFLAFFFWFIYRKFQKK